MRFDLVVAGAGGAGVVAALAAAESGCSVLVIDHLSSFRRDCNTYMSTSMIPAAGTRWQRAAGVEDSPACFLDDVMRKTGGTAYPILARSLTGVGAELVEWLADHQGLPIALAMDFVYPGHSRPRCHTIPGRSGRVLHGHLMARLEAEHRITLATPMALRRVGLNASGAVAEVTIAGPGGEDEVVATGAVVLACGGFGSDRGLVTSLIPEMAGALYFGSKGCTGDALRIGWELGADVGYLDAYQGHGAVAVPHQIMVTWATVVHGAILVNAEGRRFGDETSGYSEYARKVLEQPGGVAWVIVDRRIDALCRPFADYADLVAQGAIAWCESSEQAAARIGCAADELAATLAACRRAQAGSTDPFGRRSWEASLAPPYGVVKVTGALFHTQGGLLTDGVGTVLRGGSTIPGLFAAGGAAAGISGHGPAGYLAGNGLLAALGLGYLAGRTVASQGSGVDG